uniref:Transcription factor TFIIIB n=1 Tax=Anoplophora glabripennis TaxID=217634 RepID=V5GSX4_ANOGL
MASRRTRIKGIANIPQRRKNVSEEKTEESDNLVSEQDNEKQPAPNPVDKSEELLTGAPAESNKESDSNVPQEIGVSKDFDAVVHSNSGDATVPNPTESQTSPAVENNVVPQIVQPPKPPLKRRTFIKPQVSASVINRKPKQNVEKDHTETSVEKSCLETDKIETSDTATQQGPVENGLKEKQFISKGVSNVAREVTLDEVHLTPQIGTPHQEVESSDKGVKKIVPQTSNTPNSDTEYPPPPPSPSKINRSRIKAIPRLGYRKTSLSASESEDESKRNYNRNRNDSVCSTASGIPESITDCFSPQRPKDFNSMLQKKGNRTEQSRKLAEARRDFQRRFGASKPDRQKLTMIDLIFYNPESNPMTNEAKPKPETQEVEVTEMNEIEVESEKVDDPLQMEEEEPRKSDEENEVPAPQIKIGPTGEIILDEKSLVIESKEVQKQREELQKTKLVDGDFDTGYGIYKRQKRTKEWTQGETLRFYKALNTIGTDFTLMCELFPRRTRRELKQKFKKEERINRGLIDKAVMQPCNFDYTELKHEVEMEERELEELRKQKEDEVRLRQEKMEQRQLKKRKAMEKAEMEKNSTEPPPQPKPAKIRKVRKPRTKKLNIESVLEDSDADVSDIATQSESEGEISIPQKPTRSGRVPKVIKKFDTTEESTVENVMRKSKVTNAAPNNIEPGSIMIITETGANGEPVHKIFMVTADNNTTPLKT